MSSRNLFLLALLPSYFFKEKWNYCKKNDSFFLGGEGVNLSYIYHLNMEDFYVLKHFCMYQFFVLFYLFSFLRKMLIFLSCFILICVSMHGEMRKKIKTGYILFDVKELTLRDNQVFISKFTLFLVGLH